MRVGLEGCTGGAGGLHGWGWRVARVGLEGCTGGAGGVMGAGSSRNLGLPGSSGGRAHHGALVPGLGWVLVVAGPDRDPVLSRQGAAG
jgi:hypothetical protein